ncbi:MAG: hypothetical protein VKL39_10920, partial [Leptolyngbyaceae bacterium]|nr:hypothetical protein [Leptolyngbyaceae bacterium]
TCLAYSLFPASRWERPREPLAPVQMEPEAPAAVPCQSQGTRKPFVGGWQCHAQQCSFIQRIYP